MNILLVCNICTTEASAAVLRSEEIVPGTGQLQLVIENPPLGLLAIAGPACLSGHAVRIVNLAEEARAGRLPIRDESFVHDAAAFLAQFEADVIGFTSRSDTYPLHVLVAGALRALQPQPLMVFGGPQAAATDRETLAHFPVPDIIVRNEGDVTFPELLRVLAAGGPLESVEGITWRRDAEGVRNPDRPLVQNLDDLPLPAFDLYPYPYRRSFAELEVGRGCPFGCTFCSTSLFFNRRYRLKSPQRILAEMRTLMQLYGVRDFDFTHDLFTVNKHKVREISAAIHGSDLKVTWHCSARIDCVDDALLEQMAAAGCNEIFFGIEHGSPRMQKIINKNLNLDLVVPVIEKCRELGIDTICSFIYGFPEETVDDLKATLDLVVRLKDLGVLKVQLHRLSPLANTPIYQAYADQIQDVFNTGDVVGDQSRSAEEAELIRRHPRIFSSQMTLPLFHLNEEALHNLDTLVYSFQFYRWTVRLLLHHGVFPTLWELHRAWQAWLWQREPDLRGVVLDRNAYLRSLFDFFRVAEAGQALPDWFPDVCRYEGQVFASFIDYESRRAPGDTSVAPLRTTRPHPVVAPSVRVAHYRYPVRELVQALADDGVGGVRLTPEECIVGLHTEGGNLVSAKLNPLLEHLLVLSDGRRSARSLARALWERYGQDLDLADFTRECLTAILQLRDAGFLQGGARPASAAAGQASSAAHGR